MTKDQIKAELCRSATEDVAPFFDACREAFDAVCQYEEGGYLMMRGRSSDDIRTFFLLVAEAL